jgi:hypothetical protein
VCLLLASFQQCVNEHLWPVWLSHLFPHYPINGLITRMKSLNIKCVFWFSLQLLSETFLSLKNMWWDIVTNVLRSVINDWHSAGLQSSSWRLATNHTVALSAHSPPRPLHCYHHSGNFWIAAAYRSLWLLHIESQTPFCRSSVVGNLLPQSSSSFCWTKNSRMGPNLENMVDV